MSQSIRPKRVLAGVMMAAIIALIVLAIRAIEERTYKRLPWKAPDSRHLPLTAEGELIRYGERLIANTSYYLGPRGTIAALSNGMNCQNCHLDAGTRLFGNNYSAVFSTYPKFRDRSGTIETVHKRVNDCIERSLNGKSLDTGSREMRALSVYINWLGQNVPKNSKPAGAGIPDLPFLKRAADPDKGRLLYIQQCQRCHGKQGEGLSAADGVSYTYPPLWGEHSYTTAAGLYRISRFAGYVKNNMPFGSSYNTPLLTDEEAWDLAAFVNSQPRPERKFKEDWPNISGKPVDYPFGPYADSFSEKQHKFGPFDPITENHHNMKKLLLLNIAVLLMTIYARGQAAPYKVVFDMTSKDTINQQSLIRELGLILDSNPDASLEVVLYGQGLDLVIKDRSGQQAAVEKFAAGKRVSFKVCAIAMKRQNINNGQLLAGVETVPDGIYELISKQRDGWGYIKVAH